MSADTITIYNATDGPLPIDRAGRMLAARSSDDVTTIDGLSSLIDAEAIIVIDDLPQPDEAAGEQPTEAPAPKRTRTRATTQED